MPIGNIISALDNLSNDKLDFDPAAAAEIGRAAITVFHDHMERFITSAQQKGTVEGDDHDFIAAIGGIVLHQDSNRTAILVKVADDWDRTMFWTPRNAVFVPVVGHLAYEVFRLERPVRNEVFQAGLALEFDRQGTIPPLSCFVKQIGEISRQRALNNAPCLVVALFSEPFGQLDWAFDEHWKANRAMFANPDHSLLSSVLESLSVVGASRAVTSYPDEALRTLAQHDTYLVRWNALNLLWQGGSDDAFVANAVAQDPHPEIARHRAFFV